MSDIDRTAVNPDGTVPSDQLRRLQLNELAILVEIDRICRLNHVEYSLDGGTLLGAVRHKGFIPWDDDADVVMTRSEYTKFLAACKRDMNKGDFFLQEYRTDREYPWGYEKVRLKHTGLIRPGQEHMKYRTGIYVDLFVVDHVPDNPVFRRIHYALCVLIRKLLYSELGMKAEKSAFMRRIYRWSFEHIPRRKVFEMRNRIANFCNARKSELVSHMTYPYPQRAKYGLPSVCFTSYEDIEFEGITFRTMSGYDLYLRSHYGDYMKLPPKEEQRPMLTMCGLKMLPPEELFDRDTLEKVGWKDNQ